MGTQRERTFSIAIIVLVFGLTWGVGYSRGEDGVPVGQPFSHLPAVFAKPNPETKKDLRDQEDHFANLAEKLRPCVVGIRIGAAQGSGVVINKDGHVLTAGHVSGKPDQEAVILFADGRKAKGKTLGANRGIDSGMIKINDKGTWPFAEMGKASELKKGQWCLAIGHPGGFQPGRPPVVRLGRILESHKMFLRTDGALVGGDSGGALFDMHGKVIGIHSRIGPMMTFNIHVPVDTFQETWDRLAKGEAWGDPFGGKLTDAYLGVDFYPEKSPCKVRAVLADSPAAKAGLKNDDVVTKFDGKKIASIEDLFQQMRGMRAGREIALEVQRGSETVALRVTLGKRPK